VLKTSQFKELVRGFLKAFKE